MLLGNLDYSTHYKRRLKLNHLVLDITRDYFVASAFLEASLDVFAVEDPIVDAPLFSRTLI
jgi:hypothetical protein